MPDTRSMASPVFVDPTGRRRRTVRLTAIVGAGVLLAVGTLLVAALLGAPIVPTASLPEPVPAGPAGGANPQPPQNPRAEPTSNDPPTRPAPGDRAPASAPVSTAAPGDPATTTTTPKGNKPDQPPGRPTDLPTPPGRSR